MVRKETILGKCIISHSRKSGRTLKSVMEREPDAAPQRFNDHLRLSNAKRRKVNMSIIRWHLDN